MNKAIQFWKSLSICCLTVLFCSLFLVTTSAQPNKALFPAQQANKQFDAINLKLATQDRNVKSLSEAIEQLEGLQEKAEYCVITAQEQLQEINVLVKNKPEKFSQPQGNRADIKYLNKKKLFYENQVAQCRLFLLRAKESISAFNRTIKELTTDTLLKRKQNFWQTFNKDQVIKLHKELNKKIIITKLGLDKVKTFDYYVLLMVVSMLFIFGLSLRGYMSKVLIQQKNLTNQIILASCRAHLPPIIFLLGVSAFWRYIYFTQSFTIIEYSIYLLILYLVIKLLLAIFFYPPAPGKPWLMSEDIARKIYNRCSQQLLIILSCVIVALWQRALYENEPLTAMMTTILTSIISISVFLIAALLLNIPWFSRHKWISNTLIGLLGLGLAMILALEWLGFHNLSIYFVINSILSLALFSFLATAFLLTSKIFYTLLDKKQGRAREAQRKLGIRQRISFELQVIKLIVYLLLFYIAGLILLEIWGFGLKLPEQIIKLTTQGFSIAQIHLNPMMILIGLTSFSVLLILGKVVAAYVVGHKRFKGQRDTQMTISALIRYIAFAVALLVGLLIAGVDFTGLAIIAGALSVGIGLGMQNIVNNFVSGVILLLEKTIKPGDRIVVNDKEGYVRKVNIRYTHITTVAKEDVIVPNAELVSKQVVNYMMENPLWRVECRVGVAYGSNIQQVLNILHQVAVANLDVVNDDENNKPRALFLAFGESTLDFGLWCVIRNVNKKYTVISNLNVAIERAFREHNITIAFPQRDIHIISDNTGKTRIHS